MWERDKLLGRYYKAKNTDTKLRLFNKYNLLRNELTTKKRKGNIQYYRNHVKIKPSNKTDITIID